MERPQISPSRRAFFVRVIAAVHAVIGGTLTFVLGRAVAVAPIERHDSRWFHAADLDGLPQDQPTLVTIRVGRRDGYREVIDRRALFLVKTENDEVLALDSTCTHLGCRVNWDTETGQLLCPCHGGTYDRTGKVVSGPPPANLAIVQTHVDDGRILVLV